MTRSEDHRGSLRLVDLSEVSPRCLPLWRRCPILAPRRGVRHRLTVVLTAAVCAIVAGYRSYAAIGERVADLPDDIAVMLGIDTGRRPSEAMIRRLLQAIDPDLLAVVIGGWLAARIPAASPGAKRAIAVGGKTIRGSRTGDTAARHALAAAGRPPASCWPVPTLTAGPTRSPASHPYSTSSATCVTRW
jgi:hypothetical protein